MGAFFASEELSPAHFDPAPDSISTKWPLLVALPFVAFAIWLLIDALVLWLRKRSHHRTLVVTNEILTIEQPKDESISSSHNDRGRAT